MKLTTTLVAALVWLSASTALAHEGGTDARGTVKEITSERIVLETPRGTELKVGLVSGTVILRGERAISAQEIHAGERAVVHAAMRAGKLEAMEIKVAERTR